jgi:hypothetical protein
MGWWRFVAGVRAGSLFGTQDPGVGGEADEHAEPTNEFAV